MYGSEKSDLVVKYYDQSFGLSGNHEIAWYLRKGESSWTTRYLYQNEAIHLLYRCGLAVESLVGDYMDHPISKGSQLIIQVRKRESNDG